MVLRSFVAYQAAIVLIAVIVPVLMITLAVIMLRGLRRRQQLQGAWSTSCSYQRSGAGSCGY